MEESSDDGPLGVVTTIVKQVENAAIPILRKLWEKFEKKIKAKVESNLKDLKADL